MSVAEEVPRGVVQSTRRRCLDAGVQLFFQQPVHDDPFKAITCSAVARVAGITRQGMQNHWPKKSEYAQDLAAYLLGAENLSAEKVARVQAVVAATRDEPLIEALTKVAYADVTSLTDSPVFAAMTTLAVVYVRGNRRLTEAARRGYTGLDEEIWADIYSFAIERAGRVPRAPLTGPAIGAILQALIEGSGVRHLFDPGILSEPDRVVRSRYGLYSLAVAGILAVMTRPMGTDDMRPVEEVIETMLDSGQSQWRARGNVDTGTGPA